MQHLVHWILLISKNTPLRIQIYTSHSIDVFNHQPMSHIYIYIYIWNNSYTFLMFFKQEICVIWNECRIHMQVCILDPHKSPYSNCEVVQCKDRSSSANRMYLCMHVRMYMYARTYVCMSETIERPIVREPEIFRQGLPPGIYIYKYLYIYIYIYIYIILLLFWWPTTLSNFWMHAVMTQVRIVIV